MARILVVGPHPDDQELGMGGTIARLAEQGHDVLLLDMTNGEPTPFGDPATREKEAEAARLILSPEGGREVRRVCIDLPNRYVEHTIEARHAVAGVIRAHQAEIIFTPYPEDAHPDHRATTRIVEDARFDAKLTKVDMPAPPPMTGSSLSEIGPPVYPKWLFYYYATHLRWVADPSFVFDITGLVERKLDAVRAYHTQFVLPEKNRKVIDWVEAAATYFGSRIGTSAGEPFFTKEPVGLGSLSGLVG
ncbi:MAG: PIG-L family deacetylase [Phycisphaeraceae bacterium]|nr:MAG: PIG-L family deacetylase [Phycisphaeraceae bacterium]